MDTLPPPVDRLTAEAIHQRERHLSWETDAIAQARASVAAGRLVTETAIDAWIDSIDTAHELPAPSSGR